MWFLQKRQSNLATSGVDMVPVELFYNSVFLLTEVDSDIICCEELGARKVVLGT